MDVGSTSMGLAVIESARSRFHLLARKQRRSCGSNFPLGHFAWLREASLRAGGFAEGRNDPTELAK